ncbi:hypothetical protein C5S53_09170 [Methanophagales archaeon]|nr:hypothetical protein C5S53_09170 [Methanophagales archaeon]
MRKGFVILVAIAMITVSAAAVAVANMSDDPANSQQIKGLSYDMTAESRFTALDAAADADVVQLLHYVEEPPHAYFFLDMIFDKELGRHMDMGQAVLFSPAKPFIVDRVVINGTYSNESGFTPFTVELRDDVGKLLYKLTDISVAYFPTKPGLTVIEIPAIRIDGDFSVIFYSRTSVSVGAYVGASNNMSFVVPRGFSMEPAVAEEGVPLEWTISVAGRDA